MKKMFYVAVTSNGHDEFNINPTFNKHEALYYANEEMKTNPNVWVEGRLLDAVGDAKEVLKTLEDVEGDYIEADIVYNADYIISYFKHPYIVQVAETGEELDWAETSTEAQALLVSYEAEDKKKGYYEEGYYELAKLDADEMRYVPFAYDNKIKAARINAGLSQSQLAEESGSSVRTIQDWESCRRIPRDVYVLRNVARALGCSIEDLID